MNLIQFDDGDRAVGRVLDPDTVEVVTADDGIRGLALEAARSGRSLDAVVEAAASGDLRDYPTLANDGRLLPPIDHPDPAHVVISGTGLTHLGSADARDQMHRDTADEDLTDSMRMFRLGLEGGKPVDGSVGVQPEWFWKGDGDWLVPPGGDLVRPPYALDGGEEPEVAGVYVIDDAGRPLRIGHALANEFSDHVMERQNYLYLAHSKLRGSAIGPELRTGPLPDDVVGTVRLVRDGEPIWSSEWRSGEANMSHHLAGLEHHHFKYDGFRRPGDVHIHYFGTSVLSYAAGIETRIGDWFEIEAAGFGRPLANRLAAGEGDEPIEVGTV